MANTFADWLICHEILVDLFFLGSREREAGPLTATRIRE